VLTQLQAAVTLTTGLTLMRFRQSTEPSTPEGGGAVPLMWHRSATFIPIEVIATIAGYGVILQRCATAVNERSHTPGRRDVTVPFCTAAKQILLAGPVAGENNRRISKV